MFHQVVFLDIAMLHCYHQNMSRLEISLFDGSSRNEKTARYTSSKSNLSDYVCFRLLYRNTPVWKSGGGC